MNKYEQNKDEQLQVFRRALTRGSWWSEQEKTWKVIDRTLEVKSLDRYATSISVYVSDMEDKGCPVQEVPEAPFFMSRLLSNLDPKDA